MFRVYNHKISKLQNYWVHKEAIVVTEKPAIQHDPEPAVSTPVLKTFHLEYYLPISLLVLEWPPFHFSLLNPYKLSLPPSEKYIQPFISLQ
jgi:hypothetical protein